MYTEMIGYFLEDKVTQNYRETIETMQKVINKYDIELAKYKIENEQLKNVLMKIRAEIGVKHCKNREYDDFTNGYSVGLEDALVIIDKYKAESEPQERSDKE